jgi:hypothetical protein
MSGELIAQAIGAIGGGVQQARERQRAWDIQDQQLAQTADRFEAEKLFRSSMLENAQRQLQAQQAAAARLEEERGQQAQQYEEAVQALVARGVPEQEARVMARDQQMLRSQFAPPPEPKPARTQYDSSRGGLINLDDGTFQPIQGLPAAPAGAGRAPRTQYDAARGVIIDLDTGRVIQPQGLPDRPAAGGGGRPMTEGQRKAEAFLTQARAANEVIENVVGVEQDPQSGEITGGGRKAPTLWEGFTSRFPGAGTSNFLRSDEYRRMEAAALRLSDSWLRYTSGAAVPEPEVRRFAQSFLPAPGDDPKTLLDKAKARRLILTSLEQGVGRAGDVDSDLEARMTAPGGGSFWSQFGLEVPPGGAP